MNPFTLPGPQFLLLYAIVFAGVTAVAIWLRWSMRGPGGAAPANLDDELNPYEIAFLAGGTSSSINACLVRLVHHKVFGLAADAGRLWRLPTRVPDSAQPLEKMLAGAVTNNESMQVSRLFEMAEPTADRLRTRLEEKGLVLPRERVNRICLTSAGVTALVILFGLAKLIVGAVQNRPVGFLTILLFASALGPVIAMLRRPFRTRLGNAALVRLRYDNDALKTAAGARANELNDADLIIAIGLFGVGVLAGGPLKDVLPILRKPDPGSSSSGSCSSCSSGTSCGGGGDGGGGGCGGGGCGGCGGGGD